MQLRYLAPHETSTGAEQVGVVLSKAEFRSRRARKKAGLLLGLAAVGLGWRKFDPLEIPLGVAEATYATDLNCDGLFVRAVADYDIQIHDFRYTFSIRGTR